MVEVLEYALVVVVSSLLTAFSFGVYSGLGSVIGPATEQATFVSVVALANAAIEHGSSTSTIAFDNARIECASGTIVFSEGGLTQNTSLPVNCSVPAQDLTGTRLLTFDYSEGLLALRVS